MARYAINATITSPATGIAVPSATVTIRETDGTGALATVYQGRAGGDTFDNPLTVANGGIGSDGQLAVYLNDSVAVYYVEVDTGGATQNAKLTALAGLSGGADRLPYFNGANTMAQSTFTAFGRSLVDDANAGAARTTLGLGTAATATVTTSATDTTAGRVLTTGAGPAQAFRRGNILGTVSQSGGVPTGAIIQRGSNANGEFVRFADGTLICTITNATFSYATEAAVEFVWTYPSVFAVAPALCGLWRNAVGAAPGTSEMGPVSAPTPSATNATVRVNRIVGTTDFTIGDTLTGVRLTAIGRWY